MRASKNLALLVGGLMLAPLLTGCAGWRPTLKLPTEMPERKVRESDAVRDFEKNRDHVQLQAAMDRWLQGDHDGCEGRLRALVERRPDHTDARMRLGELLSSRGQSADAEAQFRAVLAREPNRAEAHHALGLLLDAAGQTADAHEHLARAAELEPENNVYLQTRESLAAASGR